MRLKLAQVQKVTRPVCRALDMAIHDRRSGAQTDRMGGLDDLQPLPRLQLVGANNGPDIVIQNLGCGTGKAAETTLLELCQQRRNGRFQRGRDLRYLQRREKMDMKPRRDILNRAKYQKISRAGVIGMNSTL